MQKKKKFKLKKKFKKMLVCIVLFAALIYGGINIKETAAYKVTTEYKLTHLGYELETAKLIEEKLDQKEIDYLLSEDKIDYVKDIISEEYFISDNFYDYLSYYEENSKKSFSEIVAIVNVGATKDWYEDIEDADTSVGDLVLVNKFHALSSTYDPGEIKKFSSTYAYGDVSASEVCYNAFIKMANAAKSIDGITLILTSGYRDNEYQTKIYNEMKNSKGQDYADEYAARPGSSEHETGLALDILTYNGLTDTFKSTEAYAWLSEHAYEYGFIERYPEGKEYLTGYSPEAWHYRYVGEEIAKEIKEKGITYDEYYAYYLAR